MGPPQSTASAIGGASLGVLMAVSAPGEVSAGGLLAQKPRVLELRLDGPAAPGAIDWLLPFRDASVERLGPLNTYRQGRYGRWTYSSMEDAMLEGRSAGRALAAEFGRP